MPIIPAHFTACQCGANFTIAMGHKQLPAPLTGLSEAHTHTHSHTHTQTHTCACTQSCV